MRNRWKSRGVSGADLLFAAVLLAGLLLVAAHLRTGPRFVPFSAASLTDFSTGWTAEDGSPASLTALAPQTESGGTVTVENTLPAALAQDACLNLRSKNIYFTVWIGGEARYVFAPDTGLFAGRSYGTAFHSIPLGAQDAGAAVRIELRPLYADNSCFLQQVRVGGSGAYLQYVLRSHMGSFVLCVLIVFIGAVMAAMHLVIRGGGAGTLDMGALGLLAMMLGSWSATETLVPQLLMGAGTQLHALNYLLLILLPYPAARFVVSLLEKPCAWYPRAVLAAVLAVLGLTTAMNGAGVRDYHENLPLIHAMLAATMVSAAVLFARGQPKARRRGPHRRDPVLAAAFAGLMLSAALDLAGYIVSGRGSEDTGRWVRVGMLLFFVLLFLRSVQDANRRMRLAGETAAIRRMAYTDALTGLPNRTAYAEKRRQTDEAVRSGALPRALICMFDINDLKAVNDTYGHAGGDRHLCAAAGALHASFGAAGFCARVGGDEFAAVLTQEPLEENFAAALAALEQRERGIPPAEAGGIALRLACGRALLAPGVTLEQAERAADAAMYAAKQAMKQPAAPPAAT